MKVSKLKWFMTGVISTLLIGAIVFGSATGFMGKFTFKTTSKSAPSDVDLEVTDIYLNGSTLSIDIANTGTDDVTYQYGRTYIYLDGALTKTYTWKWLHESIKTFMLAGGSSTMTPQNLYAPYPEVQVCIDATSKVSESDETNNCMTVDLDTGGAGTLDLAWESSISSYTTAPTGSGVVIGGFTLTNNVGEDVDITQFDLAGYVDIDGDGVYVKGAEANDEFRDVVTHVWLEDELGFQIGGTETFNGSGDVTFDGFQFTIGDGVTENLYLYGEVGWSAPVGGFDTNYVAVNVDDAVTNVMAELVSNGDAVNAQGDMPNGDILGSGPNMRVEVIPYVW